MKSEVIVEVQHIYSDDEKLHLVASNSKQMIHPFTLSRSGKYKPKVSVRSPDGKQRLHVVVVRGAERGGSLDKVRELLTEFNPIHADSILSTVE